MTIEQFRPYCDLTREELLQRVHAQMSDKRYEHVLRVEAKILELAPLYDVDLIQASLAALTHDYAKERPVPELQAVARTSHLDPSFYDEGSEILHGPVGAELIAQELGITNTTIRDAIREHTIGGLTMTPLSKCLFVADAIEDGRAYPGVEEARRIAAQDIDAAVLYLVKHTLTYLIDKGVKIYPGTLTVYNHLV